MENYCICTYYYDENDNLVRDIIFTGTYSQCQYYLDDYETFNDDEYQLIEKW